MNPQTHPIQWDRSQKYNKSRGLQESDKHTSLKEKTIVKLLFELHSQKDKLWMKCKNTVQSTVKASAPKAKGYQRQTKNKNRFKTKNVAALTVHHTTQQH